MWNVSDDSVDAVAFSPDGTRMAAGGIDFQARLWSVANDEKKSFDTEAPVKDLGFSRDGKRLLTGSVAGAARVWNAASGDLIASVPPVESGVATAAMSEDGSQVAVATADDRIILYDVGSSKSLLEILRQRSSATKLAFNSKGDRLAAANRNGKVRIYELDPRVLAARAIETIARNPPARADCVKYLSERNCAAYLSSVTPVQ
jgi:WD40 repeat protein